MRIKYEITSLYEHDDDVKVFSKCSEGVVGQLAEFFNQLIKNKDIKVAVRILAGEKKSLGYETVARSSRLNPSRGINSQRVPVDKGEAKLLLDNGSKGVIIYHDLDAAESEKLLFETQNRAQHRGEVECIMVAPINSWNGRKVEMIGMLYIVSNKKNAFKEKHTDIALFSADLLATLYTGVLHRNQGSSPLEKMGKQTT